MYLGQTQSESDLLTFMLGGGLSFRTLVSMNSYLRERERESPVLPMHKEGVSHNCIETG